MAAGRGQPMKALHLVKTSVGATWALRQMRELVGLGIEVHVALPPDGPLISAYESAGVVVHPLQLDFPVRRPRCWPTLFARMRDLAAEVVPDIIHSHFVGTTLTMRLALGRSHPVPRVFQVPGPLHLEHPLFRYTEIATAGGADYWIGSCRWTCERYRQSGVSEDRLFLSYYGSDLAAVDRSDRGSLRKEFGIQAATRIVGMVAYMYSPKLYLGQSRGLKGHEDLIDAISICLKTDPEIVCIFIGGAWGNAKAYERRVRAYGKRRCGERAVFLGTRTDVSDLYPEMDLVVHPSHSENLGGAAESLMLGVPTIATNVGGFPDVVLNGETGWLVPPRNPRRLAGAIRDVFRDPARAHALADQGRALARDLLDISKNAREVVQIYRSVLSRHHAHQAMETRSREESTWA